MNNNYYAKLAKNKSLLKEYKTNDCDRTVYLNDGDEFQIQLFNPETTEIAVRISIEDSQLSHDIVLRPGERIWLERYTDIAKKFKFVTYVVNGENAKVREAISHNGLINIQFYRRKENKQIYVNNPNITWINYTWNNGDSSIKVPYDYNKIYCNTSIEDTSLSLDDAALSGSFANANTTATCAFSSSSSTITASSACCDSITTTTPEYSTAVYNSDFYKDEKNLETGRVGEGRKSNQKFNNVDMEFEFFSFRTETIKILPESRKPYNSNDLKKLYCTNCGHKINTKYKFCPYCGSKID